MSAATVITEGFGSFGSKAFVVTQGFSTAAAPPPAPTASSAGGSHKRVIRLREVEDREDVAAFIKAQMALRNPEQVPAVAERKPQRIRVKGQDKATEIAMRNMAIEREQQRMIEQENEDILSILALACIGA